MCAGVLCTRTILRQTAALHGHSGAIPMRYWITGLTGIAGGAWMIAHRLLAGPPSVSSGYAAGPWTSLLLGIAVIAGGAWFIRRALRR